MSDFPEGVIAPEGAQELVDVCKETWAVTQNEDSTVIDHDEAVDRFEAAILRWARQIGRPLSTSYLAEIA